MAKLIDTPMIERRNMLTVSAGTAIAAMAAAAVPLASAAERVASAHRTPGNASVDSVTAKDGTRIFFKDWGAGKTVVLSAKLLRHASLKVYPGAPHGMCTTDADKVNADLLEFLRS